MLHGPGWRHVSQCLVSIKVIKLQRPSYTRMYATHRKYITDEPSYQVLENASFCLVTYVIEDQWNGTSLTGCKWYAYPECEILAAARCDNLPKLWS